MNVRPLVRPLAAQGLRLAAAGAVLLPLLGVAPSAAADASVPAHDVVAVVGADEQLHVRRTDQPSWTALGGRLLAAPAVVRAGGATWYVGLGGDRNLWIRSDTQDWQALGARGTVCSGAPGAAVTGAHGAGANTLGVACLGGDGAVWEARAALPAAGLPTLGTWSSVGGRGRSSVTGVAEDTRAGWAFGWYTVGGDGHTWYWSGAYNMGRTWRQASTTPCREMTASACVLTSGELRTTFYVAPEESTRTVTWTGSRVVGKPATVFRGYEGHGWGAYVLGTDGRVWTAAHAKDGTRTGFSPFGGPAARHGVAAVHVPAPVS